MMKVKDTSEMKQCKKSKPIKWCFKLWFCGSTKSRYLYRMDIYLGRKQTPEFNIDLWEERGLHLTKIKNDYSMIQTCRLTNFVIFIQAILSFTLSRKIINIYNDIAQKYENVTVKDFRKYEKLEYKKNKLKLDIDFLNSCKHLGVYLKFLIFKLPNVSDKDTFSIRKRLLRSAINKRNNELQHLSKGLSLSENCLSTQLSTIDFYILTKSITSYNKKSLQKSLCTQQKTLFSLTRDCNLPIFTANETITNFTLYELSQEESDLLKAGLYFSIQPEKIRKSQIFTTFKKIHRSFLNNLTSKDTKSQIKENLSYLANSYFYNYKPSPRILRQHRVLQNLRKKKDIVIT